MTALKKEWKGKVGVKVVRTDGYRFSIPLLVTFNHRLLARAESIVVEQMRREVKS